MVNSQNNEGTGEKPSKPVTPTPASQPQIPPNTPNPPTRTQTRLDGNDVLE